MNRYANIVLLLAAALVASSVWAQSTDQAQQLSMAEKRWADLGAKSYTYKLQVGGVFGGGVYRVRVQNRTCNSKHIGGIGLGKPKFRGRFVSESGCERRLIPDLLREVQSDLARGFDLTDMELDVMHGFLRKAHLGASKVEDQGWGFEVSDFRVLR